MNAARKSKPKVGRPKGTGGKAPALSQAQLRTLFRVTAAGPNGARNCALLSLLACGCRVAEPLSLAARDVLDLRGRVAESFVLKAENTKSRKHRRVYLNQQAKNALTAWIAESGVEGTSLLFPLNTNYATQLVATLLRNAGIKASSHSLRRTCATTMSESGISVRVIQEVLGHSSLSTTQVYLQTNPANVEKAIKVVEW